MNTEERRSLQILRGEGYVIDDMAFRNWCELKKPTHDYARTTQIVQEWKREH